MSRFPLFALHSRKPPFLKSESGVAATEFSLLVPLLVLACLATVDIGLAINEKMDIDQSLRAGSEGAMMDLGQDKVRDLVQAIASENFSIASSSIYPADALNVTVTRFCACPGTVSPSVGCTSTGCAGSAKPYLYYRLAADKKYKSIFLPIIPLRGSVLVEVQ
jgi:pilus assembly protein CpaE